MLRLSARSLWRFLGRVDVAVVLLAAALVLVSVGSLFPQRPPSLGSEPVVGSRWDELAGGRYGSLAGALERLGVFGWYRTPALVASIVILAVSTLVCTLDRWRPIWRRLLDREVICTDQQLKGARFSMSLGKIRAHDSAELVRQALEEKGFRVRLEERDRILYWRGDRNPLAPAASLVSHLGVVLTLLAVLVTAGFAWREPLAVPANATSVVRHMPGVKVGYQEFEVARYPDGSAADYQATIYLMDGPDTVRRGRIRPNEPLTYAGMSFYLQGFAGSSSEQTLLLLAVCDPGYAYVVAAGLMVVLGFAVSFNFPHVCVRLRIGPDGEAWLAAHAGRRAYGFEVEFGLLAGWLKQRLGNTEGKVGGGSS